MHRTLIRLAALAALAACGCSLPATGGRAYDIDASKIGTGEQAVVPRNDSQFWNGQQMDTRSPRK
jgi:hypothetical protein